MDAQVQAGCVCVQLVAGAVAAVAPCQHTRSVGLKAVEGGVACALLQCDVLWHGRPVSEPDDQAKADVYALSMGRRVAGECSWGLVWVELAGS